MGFRTNRVCLRSTHQTCIHIYIVEPEVNPLTWAFICIPFLFVQGEKALARLQAWTGSSEPSLLVYVIYTYFYHIFWHILPWLPKVCICDKLFPANWLSACRDVNQKSCILNGERLSCPACNVDHLMTSDVNKWREVAQKLCHSSVLLTFLTPNALKKDYNMGFLLLPSVSTLDHY